MSTDGIVEVKNEKSEMVGYKCQVCGRFFGLYEHAQAVACLEAHRTRLDE